MQFTVVLCGILPNIRCPKYLRRKILTSFLSGQSGFKQFFYSFGLDNCYICPYDSLKYPHTPYLTKNQCREGNLERTNSGSCLNLTYPQQIWVVLVDLIFYNSIDAPNVQLKKLATNGSITELKYLEVSP